MNLIKKKDLIDGNNLFLSVLLEEHATDKYAGWLNDSYVNNYLETREVSKTDLVNYINEKFLSDNSLFFGIFFKENSEHIGNIKLEPIDFDKEQATLGIIIGEKEYWGRGLATEATNSLVDYAFSVLGLKEVRLGVVSENKAAIKVYAKCGFKVFEIKEKAIDHNGEKFDQVFMRKLNY